MGKVIKKVCPVHDTELWMLVHGMVESVYVCRELNCNTRVVVVGEEPRLDEKEVKTEKK